MISNEIAEVVRNAIVQNLSLLHLSSVTQVSIITHEVTTTDMSLPYCSIKLNPKSVFSDLAKFGYFCYDVEINYCEHQSVESNLNLFGEKLASSITSVTELSDSYVYITIIVPPSLEYESELSKQCVSLKAEIKGFRK